MKRILITTLALTMLGPAGYDDRGLIVSSSGTLFVTSTVIDTSTHTATTSIKAISSSGSMISATVSNSRDLELLGGNLISASETTASDGTVSPTLTAISASSGSVAWTRTLSGRVTSLEPFSGGTYAIIVVPATSSGGSAARSLVAIGNDGTVLWTVSLT